MEIRVEITHFTGSLEVIKANLAVIEYSAFIRKFNYEINAYSIITMDDARAFLVLPPKILHVIKKA